MSKSVQIEKPHSSRPQWILPLAIILGLALLAFPFLFMPTRGQPPLEISNFVGKPEIYSQEKGAWIPAERGGKIGVHDKIRTDDKTEVDLRLPDMMSARLKPGSQLEGRGAKFYEKDKAYRMHLQKGSILVSAEKALEGNGLKVSTPVMVAAVRSTMFQVRYDPSSNLAWVGVLRGKVDVESKTSLFGKSKSVTVESLEKTEFKSGEELIQPVRLSREEWDGLKEAYELIQKSAAAEAAQIDLSKKAGNLFEFVYDQGTFYMPKIGYAGREFIQDETTGEVYMEAEYDVFPTTAFTGIYILTRNLDLSKFQAFEFEARRKPGERFPEQFRIELKSKGDVLRGFSPKQFKSDWEKMSFPINFTKPTPITEFTFVFANDKVGEYKRGALQFKNFTLVPAPPRPEGEEPPAAASEAPAKKAAASKPAVTAPKTHASQSNSAGATKVSLKQVPKAGPTAPPPAEEKTTP